MSKYNDLLDPDKQLDAEEWIASYLFDQLGVLTEWDAQRASQNILLEILSRFRKDLIEEVEE